jgi:hypothetical protein
MIIYDHKLQILFSVRIKVWILCRAKYNICYDFLLCEMNTEEYLTIIGTYLMSICVNIQLLFFDTFQAKAEKKATVTISMSVQM